MKTKKNICVIGSGFSGLSSATYLANKGHNVYVLEKNSKLGGRARKFSSKGFTFDMGPSWYWMPDVFEKYFKDFDKNINEYNTIVIWCESFNEFITAGQYIN